MNENEMEIFYLINEERISHGLDPLILDKRLVQSTYQKNEDIKTQESFNSRDFVSHIRKYAGGDYNRFGEIITFGDSTDKIFKNLKKCSGKKSNILNLFYTHIGLTVLYCLPRIKMATVHFASEK